MASWKGHIEIVRTLLEKGAEVEAKTEVRNHQMRVMMMMTICIIFTISMMMTMIVVNDDGIDEDADHGCSRNHVCR